MLALLLEPTGDLVNVWNMSKIKIPVRVNDGAFEAKKWYSKPGIWVWLFRYLTFGWQNETRCAEFLIVSSLFCENFKAIGDCREKLCSIRDMHDQWNRKRKWSRSRDRKIFRPWSWPFFDQQKISDRLVYNMYRFVAKIFFLQQGRGKTQNRPLWKIRHAQKFEPHFFYVNL